MTGLLDLLAGTVLAVVGGLALLLSLFRARRIDLLLASFGSFSLLYGARLFFQSALLQSLGISPLQAFWVAATITYVINVPAWTFFYAFFGRGRRSILLWWLAVVSAFACLGVASDLLQGRPGTLTRHPNNLLVITGLVIIAVTLLGYRRRMTAELRVLSVGLGIFGVLALNDNLQSMGALPWAWRGESIGFVFFVASLGWVAAHRFFKKERQLAALEGEMATARSIQLSLLPDDLPEDGPLEIAVRFRPTSAVAGDLYDFPEAERDAVSILIADVSGHGVPAALVASMLKSSVASQSGVLSQPAELLRRVNHTLCGSLRSGFVTAAYTRADLRRREWIIATGGHPPPLLSRKGEHDFAEVGGHGPLLGRFRSASYAEETIALKNGDRLVLFTDCLVEALSPDGEPFGEERLRSALAESRDLGSEDVADALLAQLEAWVGGRPPTLEDDLTLLIVDVEPGAKNAD